MFLYFGGLGSSTNRTFPSSRFIPRATRRPLLELSIHVCAILEIAPHFKAFSKTREKLWKPLRLCGYPVGFYFPYSGRLNKVAELNGFYQNANPATVEW